MENNKMTTQHIPCEALRNPNTLPNLLQMCLKLYFLKYIFSPSCLSFSSELCVSSSLKILRDEYFFNMNLTLNTLKELLHRDPFRSSQVITHCFSSLQHQALIQHWAETKIPLCIKKRRILHLNGCVVTSFQVFEYKHYFIGIKEIGD